ncbi:unnamed protein product [Prorocentrum cordatum]|uniref:Uncharacterized protein n=1 Tax=Prorocentrum cordatum TaxID=2364126 RepID=A0ABN9QBU7_9DINO|nr:unnamed protein product [Polarella glacialis]
MEGLRQARAASSGELLAVGEAPLKIVCLSSDPDGDAAAARQALPEGLVHVIAQHVEFVDPGVSKGLTLERLCGTLLGSAGAGGAFYNNIRRGHAAPRWGGRGHEQRQGERQGGGGAQQRVVQRRGPRSPGVARELRALLDSGELAGPPGEE